MKKLVTLFALSALAVLVGCQREMTKNDTPEETGVREVTTQFVLNVASVPQTKMSAEVVQMDHNFRGMDNVKLFVYSTGMVTDKQETSKNAYVLNTSGWTNENSKSIDLGVLYAANTVTNTGDDDENTNRTESSNRILQLSLPVGTDAVALYGKAIKGNNAKSAEYGGTNMSATTISRNPGETVIAAQRVLDTEDQVAAYDATASLMIYLINDILGMEVPHTLDVLYGFPGTTYQENQGTEEEPNIVYGHCELSWNALGHQYEIQTMGDDSRYSADDGFGMGRNIQGLEEVLGGCYYRFTYIKQGEIRTGSSGAVKRMIADMYKVIKDASDATPTNEYEANAKRLAAAILKRAQTYFSIDGGGEYYPLSEIKTSLGSSWQATWDKAKDLNGYPFEDFGIPRGAAQLAFRMEGEAISTPSGAQYDADNDNKYDNDVFYYLHPNKPLVNPNAGTFEPRKYMHPAELWYYVNSPIRTTDATNLLTGSYPNGVDPWNLESNWTADKWEAKGKVQSSTRGVAVKNSINYGVALLKSSVALSDESYYDNRKAMTNNKEADRKIEKKDVKLELHGILVGGVNPRMNWQFTRKYTDGDYGSFDGVIYDSSIESKAVPTASGEENYTLVYDNYNSTGAGNGAQSDQNNVYIALEFKNNGDAFWGRDNLIPKDGYFYLVANILAPTTAQINSLASKWPTDHQIPPVYGINGATDYSGVTGNPQPGDSKKIARVFIQDFMTVINFKLRENSLKNAYYTMPDLRASQMSLGLSVDLQWIPGLEIDAEL